MKPEIIMQSTLLDILFYGRNKAYGAYTLRNEYNQRLAKSMIFTFSTVLLLSIAWYVKANYFNGTQSLAAGEPTTVVTLKNIEDNMKPKPVEKQKAATKSAVKQVANPVFVIVPDKLADKPLPKNDDLNNAQIGLANVAGKTDSGFIAAPPGPESFGTATVIPVAKPIEENIEPLDFAEKMPQFPGGQDAFMKFMVRNLKEPVDLEEGEKVVVRVRFVVEADGEIGKVEIMNSGSHYDAEVQRVIKKMPSWIPGLQNGMKVPVYFTLPITFQRSE